MLNRRDRPLTQNEVEQLVDATADLHSWMTKHGLTLGITLMATVFGSRECQTMILFDRHGKIVAYCIGDGLMTGGEHALWFMFYWKLRAGIIS